MMPSAQIRADLKRVAEAYAAGRITVQELEAHIALVLRGERLWGPAYDHRNDR